MVSGGKIPTNFNFIPTIPDKSVWLNDLILNCSIAAFAKMLVNIGNRTDINESKSHIFVFQ